MQKSRRNRPKLWLTYSQNMQNIKDMTKKIILNNLQHNKSNLCWWSSKRSLPHAKIVLTSLLFSLV